MQTLDILQKVYALFNNKKAWTQDAWARDANGFKVYESGSSKSTCWCLGGGVRHITKNEGERNAAFCAISRAIPKNKRRGTGVSAVIRYNDTKGRTYTEIKKVLRDAIKTTKLKEARQ